MLDQLQLQNIGAFPSLHLGLDRLTILVGPNGSGKSTVLKALSLLCAWQRGEIEAAQTRIIDEFQGGHEAGSHQVKIYPLSGFQDLGLPRLTATQWAIKAQRQQTTYELHREANRAPFLRRNSENLLLSGELLDDSSSQMCEVDQGGLPGDDRFWFDNLRYYTRTPQDCPRAKRLQLERSAMVAPSIPSGEHAVLGRDGSGLASVLAELMGTDREAIERIEADLARIVPQALRIRSKPTRQKRLVRKPFPIGEQAVSVPVEEEVFAHRLELDMKGSGSVPAELLSEGTLFALGLLTALHHPDRPELLLIDDLHRGLHLSGQVRVVEILRGIQERIPALQIIGSTHSPFQLDGVEPQLVRVFGLREDGTADAKRLTDHPEFERWSRAFRTAELWANLGEGWVTGRADG